MSTAAPAEPEVKASVLDQFRDVLKGAIDPIRESIDKTKAEIEELRKPVHSNGTPGALFASPKDQKEEDKWGYKHFGEYAKDVGRHVVQQNTSDRLKSILSKATSLPSNYANEGVGADGGFLVPPEFSRELLKHTFNEESLLPRTRQFRVSGNTLTIPKDETVPWGSDGVQAYWLAEAAAKTESKPKFGEVNLTLHKLAALVPVTDELLQDSFINLGDYISETASGVIRHKVDEAIVNGTGAGQPLGFMKSGALITVSKEVGQDPDTVEALNVAKMFARLPSGSMLRSDWIFHSTVFPQLVTMLLGTQPVWMNGNNISGAPFGTIFGRPILPSEQLAVLGDKGDIILADLKSYITVTKTTDIESAMSIHLYFDRDITTFRFVFRVGGMPWMSAPITQKNGGGTLSPFVTLEAR